MQLGSRASGGPMTGTLWLTVLGLAALDTLSPTTLAVTIWVLLSGRQVARRTFTYLATLGACYLTFGVVLMVGLDAAIDIDALLDESLDPHFFGAGLLLIAISFVLDPGTKQAKQARRDLAAQRAAARRAGQDQRLRRSGLFAMVAIGVTTFALEFLTVAPYMAAIAIMTADGVPPGQWLVALLAYNTVMIAPSLGLLAAWLIWNPRLRARFDGWAERLDAAARPAAAWVVAAVGVILLLDTAPGILGGL